MDLQGETFNTDPGRTYTGLQSSPETVEDRAGVVTPS